MKTSTAMTALLSGDIHYLEFINTDDDKWEPSNGSKDSSSNGSKDSYVRLLERPSLELVSPVYDADHERNSSTSIHGEPNKVDNISIDTVNGYVHG